MHETILKIGASGVLNRSELMKIRVKAIRAGVWFKALPRIDRALIELTIEVVKDIRSRYLAKSLFTVLSKLEVLLEGKFLRLARTVGQHLAEKISMIAQNWGNSVARQWSADKSFALYLAVMHSNI